MGRNKKYSADNSKYSSYWFDEDDYTVSTYYGQYGSWKDDATDAALDKEDLEWEKKVQAKSERLVELIKLAAFMRSCGNFVRILTGRDDISVKYEDGDHSYTDGKVVTLSSKVENNFDSTVGLALHEASHIVLTEFDLLTKLFVEPKFRRQWVTQDMIKKVVRLNPKIENWNWGELFRKSTIYPKFEPNCSKATQAADIFLTMQFKDILNWVEDRRIDNYVYSSAPGYRGYYEALYNRYFYSDEVTKDLKNNETYNTETLDSYMYRLINMMNPENDLSVLKGMKDIKQTVNLNSISRLKNTKDVAEVSKSVLDIIMSNITSLDYTQQQMMEFGFGDGSGGQDGMTIDIDSLTDEQCKEMFGMGKKKLKKLLDRMAEQRDFIRGQVDKKKLSKSDTKQMNTLANAGITMELAGGEEFNGQTVKVLMIEKISDAVVESDEFAHVFNTWDLDYHREAVEKGIVLGKMLGKRLQVRNEERTLKFTRQDKGKIDRRLVHMLGYDNANVFSRVEVNKFQKAHIHISVDASGSMSGEKFFNAMKTSVAIATASTMVSNLECVISFRTTGEVLPIVCVAYDSRVNKLSHIRKFFPLLAARGTTPESLCFEAMMNKVFPKVHNGEQFYFVNLSDGEPTYSQGAWGRGGEGAFHYYGESAFRHCRRMVDRMVKDYGATIISYFISSWDGLSDNFRKMYGNDNVFLINTDSVEQIAKTMNRKFLENGKEAESIFS